MPLNARLSSQTEERRPREPYVALAAFVLQPAAVAAVALLLRPAPADPRPAAEADRRPAPPAAAARRLPAAAPAGAAGRAHGGGGDSARPAPAAER